MKTHNTSKHESEISCSICGKMFRTTSTLEEHTKSEHEASQSQLPRKTQKCKISKSYEEQLSDLERFDYPRVQK